MTVKNDKKIGGLLIALLLMASPGTAQHVQQLAGQWTFVAANNGKEIAPGIYSAGTDEASFTASIAADGQSLDCYADCLYKSKQDIEYPAKWRLLVEENSEGHHRIGWVLSKEQPAFTKEFAEPQSSYLENGFYYWGSGSEEHHYIYLLAENEDASAYVAPVFWSAWSSADTQEYSLSSPEYNAQKLYARVAASIPYANSIGCIEIWASVKLKRVTSAGITIVNSDSNADGVVVYDLLGVRQNGLKKGLNIVDGRKVVR